MFNWKAAGLCFAIYLPTRVIGPRSFICKPFHRASCSELIHPHFFRNVASSILQITYGYEVTRTADDILTLVQDAAESPRDGPYLVDHFPLCE